MNFSFTKKNNENDVYIAFDIRSASVGASIFSADENYLPTIKYTVRQNVYFENSQDSQNFTKKIYEALDKVIEEIFSNGFKSVSENKKKLNIKSISCALSSPWYKSKLKNFTINEEKEVLFTKEYFNNLLKKENENEKISSNFSILEKKILSVYMNGYETEDPFNKKAKNIRLSFYTSYLDSKNKKDLEDRISEKFHFNKINFYTHPFVNISVIKNTFHTLTDFLLVDVGGEITDVGLFKNGILQSLVSIPTGTHLFVRELVNKCSYDKNIAFSKLNMLSSGKLDTECAKPIEEILIESKKNWLEKIEKSIETEWQKEKIPSMVFISVDNEVKSLIENIFTDKEIYRIFKINRQPIIHILNSETIKNLCEYKKGVKKYALLSIISQFIILESH